MQGIPQSIAELIGAFNLLVQQQLLVAVTMYLEETEEAVVAPFQFCKESARQPPVKKFEPAADGFFFLKLEKFPRERS